MRKSKLLIASLIIGVVVSWLSLFSTDLVFAASYDKSIYEVDNIQDGITISGVTKSEKDGIKKAIKEINVNLNDAGYFLEATLNKSGKTTLSTKDFLSVKEDSDTVSKGTKKQNNTTIEQKLYNVTINGQWNVYNGYDTDQKTEIYTILLRTIQNSNDLTQGYRVKIYNYFVSKDEVTSNLVRQLSLDVNADFAGAYSSMKGVFPTIAKIFGVIAIVIFLGITLTMLVDISYIVIPTLQLLDDGKEPPKFFIIKVSQEAWKAVRETEKAESHVRKDTLAIYLRSKTKQLVILSVCVLYLVSGKIYLLLSYFMDLFKGFLMQ